MAKSDPNITEQEHHRKAFEFYYSMGGSRSMARVAKEMGVSLSSAKLWSRAFSWRQRIWERDANTARHIADSHMQKENDEHGRNKKIVKMAILKVAKAIHDGKVRMIQVGDLDRLMRLEQLLSESVGEPGRQDGRFRSYKDVDDYLETLSSADLAKLSQWPPRKLNAPPPSAEEDDPDPEGGN